MAKAKETEMAEEPEQASSLEAKVIALEDRVLALEQALRGDVAAYVEAHLSKVLGHSGLPARGDQG